MNDLYHILYVYKDELFSFYRYAIEDKVYRKEGMRLLLRYKEGRWLYKVGKTWTLVQHPYHLLEEEGYLSIKKIDELPIFDTCFYHEQSFIIGRSMSCILRYDHQEVSRHHIKIEKQQEDWYVTDLHSRNGVYVNGIKVDTKRLEIGDCIQFSQYTIYFFPYCLCYEKTYASKMKEAKNQFEAMNTLELRIQPIKLPVFDVACIQLQPPNNNMDVLTHSWMQVLPTMLMGISSIMMSAMMFITMSRGQFDVKHMLPSVVMMVVMVMMQTLLPILLHGMEKKQQKKRQAQAKEEYQSYLKMKDEALLAQAHTYQEFNKYYSSLWIPNTKLTQIPIWFVRSSHEQFLSFTLGYRKSFYNPYCDFTPLEVTQPKKECEQWYQMFLDQRKKVIDQSIFYPFKKYKSIGIYGKEALMAGFNILWQVCKNQSPKELVLLIILPEDITRTYHMRFLPHLWLSKQVRLLYKTCTTVQFEHALERIKEKNMDCLIVSDQQIPYLPKEHCYWLQISKNKDVLSSSHTIVFECEEPSIVQVQEYQERYQLHYQGYQQSYFIQAFQQLSSFLHSKKQYPPFYFLDLYQVCDVKDLHIKKRWNKHYENSLEVPIGIDEEKKILYLDAHASKHGPHGILAGMTGAGKSEWLMTYILSLCITFSCEKVSFVIVDYKGGMMGNAFLSIPHICNVITNLEKHRIHRFLDALESEILMREAIFEEAKEKMGASFCDIDLYQNWYDKGIVKQAVAHLFLIVDEFAEMKMESPQALQKITKIARIGRSLGIHVLLATQKPYGIIDDQIWSNSHFHVCLKVQERSDSMDVIKKEDAMTLKEAGEFFLQVGHDEYFVKGKSSYTQAPYSPSQEYEQASLKTVDIYQDQGEIIQTKQLMKQDGQTQFEAVCFELARVQKECKYQKPFFLPRELEPKNCCVRCSSLELRLGEYEDSKRRKQGTWMLRLDHLNNVLVVASNVHELEAFVKQLCFECERLYTSKQCVVLLFHSHLNLEQLNELSIVSLICSYKETEKIDEVLEQLEQWKQAGVELILFLHEPATFKVHHPIFLQRLEQELSMPQVHLHIIVLSKHINTLSMSMFTYMEQFVIFHMQDEKEYRSYFQELPVYPRFLEGNGVYMDEDNLFEIQLQLYDDAIQKELLHLNKEKNPSICCFTFPSCIQAQYKQDQLFVGLSYDDQEEVWLSLQERKQVFIVSIFKTDYVKYLYRWKEKTKCTWQIQTHDYQEMMHCIYVLTMNDVYAMQFYAWFRTNLLEETKIWIGQDFNQGAQVLHTDASVITHEQDAVVIMDDHIKKVRRLEV